MNKEHGFTLIELLVVVAIIGILAAIAIPQFTEYRQRAFDARAKSDLVALATAEEAYYVDNESYKSCANAGACATALPGFQTASSGVSLAATKATNYFTATATHSSGSGTTYTWNSGNGGLQ
ncbi:MAG: prepilin-type N-terminal cleavage/methylation domain-containing protein [Candidatus Dadabacteria bacterium]|nr:MAG: prepilin-type N-terminal cleavage/methylation domain-containing protein [Candidatus Dadabacteria bacterium]